MTDSFDLQRFLDAQAPIYPGVLEELRAGRDEALAYVGHVVLGLWLRDCATLVNAIEGRTIREILGSPDDLKFHFSITLFGAVSSDPKFAVSRRRVEIGDGFCWSGAWPLCSEPQSNVLGASASSSRAPSTNDQVRCCAFKQPRTFAQLLNWRMLTIWFETIYCLNTGDPLI
jgi:hypothetical protein